MRDVANGFKYGEIFEIEEEGEESFSDKFLTFSSLLQSKEKCVSH